MTSVRTVLIATSYTARSMPTEGLFGLVDGVLHGGLVGLGSSYCLESVPEARDSAVAVCCNSEP